MPTIFIASMAVSIPPAPLDEVGRPMTEEDAEILTYIRHTRVISRLTYLLKRGDISVGEVQSKAIEFCQQKLVPYSVFDEDTDTDPVMIEALSIARDLIVAQMAQEGLPPPKGLETHARALVDAMPGLQERARLRVEARFKAANAAIGGI